MSSGDMAKKWGIGVAVPALVGATLGVLVAMMTQTTLCSTTKTWLLPTIAGIVMFLLFGFIGYVYLVPKIAS